MVAAVQNIVGEIVAVHRTYLRADGDGKANLVPDKMMLGPCAGGAVRFAKPAEVLAIAEGIETALSIVQACSGLAVWASLSTSGMKTLQLPSLVREVIVCADADDNGAGQKAASDAAMRFIREGRRVRVAHPGRGRDFNDLLNETVA
jgi:phage/plasmid primase-like uncharacterized protein